VQRAADRPKVYYVTDVGYVPMLVFLGLCSRVAPDVRDRQTDVRQTSNRRQTKASLNAWGGGIIIRTLIRHTVSTPAAEAQALLRCTTLYNFNEAAVTIKNRLQTSISTLQQSFTNGDISLEIGVM